MQQESRNLIFIVAYNHETLLPATLARIPAALLADPRNEVLIIDDASTDQTFFVAQAVAQQLAQRSPPLSSGAGAKFTVLKNPVNQGYGGNQKIGYRYAIDNGFTHVFLVHGDGQYAPELLSEFISQYQLAGSAKLAGADNLAAADKPAAAAESSPDAIFGTRMHSWASALRGGMPFYKLVGNIILTFLQNKLLRSRLSEFHSGYRSYSTALLKKIPFERNSNDFHFDTEIIIQILAFGGRIQELSIPTHYGDEVCHVNGFRYAIDVLRSSAHFKLQRAGFLYDRKFDVGVYHYPEKPNRYSSHSMLIASIEPQKKVLDIGCGTGSIATALIRDKKCTVDGVDLLPPERGPASLRQYWSIDLNQNLEALQGPLKDRHYDYIILADILEHILDPERFLEFLRKHALQSFDRHGRVTRIHATTGNVAFLVVRAMLLLGQFNYGPKGILDRTHTRLFTRKSFAHIFDQCGFKVLKLKPIPLPFTAIFSPDNRAARGLERLNYLLCKVLPGLFAYQFLLEVEILPTVEQLLKNSTDYSKDLQNSPN